MNDEVAKSVVAPQTTSSVLPTNGEWFNLEVDNDIDPMSVVASSAVSVIANWQYVGPRFSGKLSYRVKLTKLGNVANLAAAKAAAKALNPSCRLLEGQAREPLRVKYPRHIGHGLVVLGGSEWKCPKGRYRVATLDNLFCFSAEAFGEAWLWAMVEDK